MANAGILDNEIESYVKQCISKIILPTSLITQSEKNESEEDLKLKDEIFSHIEQKEPDEAYYKAKDIESDRCASLCSELKSDKLITKLFSHIKEGAESNEKVIKEISEKQWLGQLSKDQIDLLASFVLVNTAIYCHYNERQFLGEKYGFSRWFDEGTFSVEDIKYIDNKAEAEDALKNYSDSKSHRFPVEIAKILENVSNEPVAYFKGRNYSRSCNDGD